MARILRQAQDERGRGENSEYVHPELVEGHGLEIPVGAIFDRFRTNGWDSVKYP